MWQKGGRIGAEYVSYIQDYWSININRKAVGSRRYIQVILRARYQQINRTRDLIRDHPALKSDVWMSSEENAEEPKDKDADSAPDKSKKSIAVALNLTTNNPCGQNYSSRW